MELVITTHIPAAATVLSGSLFLCCAGGSAVSLPDDREAIVTVIPADGSGRLMPAGCVIAPDDGRFSISAGCETARIVDWGRGRAELIVNFRATPFPEGMPKLLDTIDFVNGSGEQTHAALFCDGGLRLAVSTAASERSYAICAGNCGSLQLLDIGSERLIIVHASGCNESVSKSKRFYGFEFSPHPRPREMLIALDEDIGIIASVEGDSCFIGDGYLVSVERLGTVFGHERRVRFELSGREKQLYDTGIGYYSAPKKQPASPNETALALLECVLLGRKDEALELLSAELAAEVGFDGLAEFFGGYDEARPVPPFGTETQSGQNGLVMAGTVTGDKAVPFEFTVEGGVITDVSEAEG